MCGGREVPRVPTATIAGEPIAWRLMWAFRTRNRAESNARAVVANLWISNREGSVSGGLFTAPPAAVARRLLMRVALTRWVRLRLRAALWRQWKSQTTISDVFGQSLRARARLNGNLEL